MHYKKKRSIVKQMAKSTKQTDFSFMSERKAAGIFYMIITPAIAVSVALTFFSARKAYPFPSSYFLIVCAAIQIAGWVIGVAATKKMVSKTREIIAQTQKIQKIQERLIISIADLVESKDALTGQHVQRTAHYVERICKKMIELGYYPDELNEHTAQVMKKAAPLHDMGKMNIPETILGKQGKLTAEEFDMIKMHPLWGEKIIDKAFAGIEDDEFTQTALMMALTHHEWWNGSGYPLRLAEKEIPLCGRIMAAADVLDALLTVRPYKRAYTVDETMNIIADNAGKQFDPLVAEAVLELETEITYLQIDAINDSTIDEARRKDTGLLKENEEL